MPNSERINLYTAIHKALRALMCDTLVTVGRADPADAGDVATALEAVRGLLVMARGHLHHEDEFLHPAMQARRPGSAAETLADHARHVEAFAALEAGVRAVERADAATRADALLRLYRQLALFVAENFEHMHVEETENHAVLADCYDDAELLALQARLIASVPPAEMQVALRWMMTALSAPERALLLSGMQATAPAAAVAAVLAMAQAQLAPRDWAKLVAAIGPAPAAAQRRGADTAPALAV
jgi:hypothetical protein